jgi:hypothetical protein
MYGYSIGNPEQHGMRELKFPEIICPKLIESDRKYG